MLRCRACCCKLLEFVNQLDSSELVEVSIKRIVERASMCDFCVIELGSLERPNLSKVRQNLCIILATK